MKPMWQTVLDAHDDVELFRILRAVLRTRRRGIPISLNGRTQLVLRATVRDYLQEKIG